MTVYGATELSFEERFGIFVDCELTFRENRRLKTLLKMARLKMQADVNDVYYNSNRNINRPHIGSLAMCKLDWAWDPVGPVPEDGFQQILKRDITAMRVDLRFSRNDVRLADMELRGILYQ